MSYIKLQKGLLYLAAKRKVERIEFILFTPVADCLTNGLLVKAQTFAWKPAGKGTIPYIQYMEIEVSGHVFVRTSDFNVIDLMSTWDTRIEMTVDEWVAQCLKTEILTESEKELFR